MSVTPERMKAWLDLLIEWGVPEEKAKKLLIRSAWDLDVKEVNEIFTNSPLSDRSYLLKKPENW